MSETPTSTQPLAPLRALLKRDILLAARRRAEVLNPFLFFVLVTALVPLGVGAEPATLSKLAPGIIWIAALLASLLALESLFRSDFDDGSLELMLMSPYPATLMVFAKVLAHWLLTGLPLVVASPLLAAMLGLAPHAYFALALSLLLGTPTLSLVGAIGVALTVGLRRGGALMSLLVLPLYIPILIFGANAVNAAAAGLPNTGQLYFLAALLVLAMTLGPLASTAALRISVN
ncbi:MAG: heme exporter protein B [Gammaproteobacteria bacterium]|jgi:heme exporter protein B